LVVASLYHGRISIVMVDWVSALFMMTASDSHPDRNIAVTGEVGR